MPQSSELREVSILVATTACNAATIIGKTWTIFAQARAATKASICYSLKSGGTPMFSIPNPLHPAIVHFPIVLLLLGAAVAVASVFVNRWQLAWAAAGLLGLGAVGCFFAVNTGDAAQETAGKLPAPADALVDTHEEWAKRTEIVGAIAGVLAIGAAALGVVPILGKRTKQAIENDSLHSRVSRGPWSTVAFTARILTATVALAACFYVYETARRGGELVYTQGVGVRSAPAQGSRTAPAEND
jgi:uncharacterized membrane protein